MKYLALLVALLSSACTTVIPYEPDAHMTREEARLTLRQAFEEQPEKFRPIVVEIGDDAIRLGSSTVKSNAWTGDLTTVEKRETYYFSNLAALQFVQKRTYWAVKLSIRDANVRRWVYFYSEKQATDFLDAMSRMAQPD